MAAALPRGITGPATGSWATGEDDARWILVRAGRAYLYATSGRYFFSQVAAYLGIAAPSAVTREFLRAFRQAMLAAALDVSQVSETELTRETLRAMCWWVSEDRGRREGTPSTAVWLPGRIAAPALGQTMLQGVTGIRSEPLSAPASGNDGGAVILGNGGSLGGHSSSGHSSGPSSGSGSGSGSGVAEAAMMGGKVLVVGALAIGAVVAAARVAQGRNPLDQPALPWRAPSPSKGSVGAPTPPTTPAPRAPRERSAPSNASAAVRAALKGGA